MHFRLLVTTAPGSSLAARRRVTSGLYEQGFIKNFDQRWSGGIADWFVIGGRWTGHLAGISGDDFRCRNPYAPLGADDDAMLLTAALYDKFLAPYEGMQAFTEYVDLEYEELSRAFVGRKWLVVVDYHC